MQVKVQRKRRGHAADVQDGGSRPEKKEKKQEPRDLCGVSSANHTFHSATYFSDDHQLHSLVNAR